VDAETQLLVREMADRQAIRDCLMRYCRGIDRLDRELFLSAYHPGAIDDHGPFVGPAEAFVDYAFDLHGRGQLRTQHHITNHLCEIDGDVAHAESYFLFRGLNRKPPLYSTASGRYLDRFERIDGRWAIAARICIVDIRNDHWAPTGTEGDADYMPSLRSPDDPSYMRPLTVDPSRLT
jgi:hypothetical protein